MRKQRSIRVTLTIWFSVILLFSVGVTFLAVRFAGSLVLRNTVRDYLIGTVEENADEILFVEKKGDKTANLYLSYEDGFLQIDRDFMQVVNDVHTALYTADGLLLYGENPLPKLASMPFTTSHTGYFRQDGVRYDYYDRKLNIDGVSDGALFIRGIVAETENVAQLSSITRISLFLLPILLFLALLSGYILIDRLLLPLHHIEKTAEQISRGDDLKQRISAENLGKGRQADNEIGRLARTFNRMLDRLESAFEKERQFTSDISHELRTPITVILTQSEYTLEKERTDEEYRDALKTVEKQGKRMERLISDMLHLARMEQAETVYAFSRVNFSEIVTDAARQEAFAHRDEKNITMTTAISPDLYLNGNETLLSRLTQNLISNAYRYGVSDGHVSVSLSKTDEGICLSVRDDGIGIVREEQEKIFNRFYRVDTSRTGDGTGLGLSMVKQIATLHNAKISVESEIHKGSNISLMFAV